MAKKKSIHSSKKGSAKKSSSSRKWERDPRGGTVCVKPNRRKGFNPSPVQTSESSSSSSSYSSPPPALDLEEERPPSEYNSDFDGDSRSAAEEIPSGPDIVEETHGEPPTGSTAERGDADDDCLYMGQSLPGNSDADPSGGADVKSPLPQK